MKFEVTEDKINEISTEIFAKMPQEDKQHNKIDKYIDKHYDEIAFRRFPVLPRRSGPERDEAKARIKFVIEKLMLYR